MPPADALFARLEPGRDPPIAKAGTPLAMMVPINPSARPTRTTPGRRPISPSRGRSPGAMAGTSRSAAHATPAPSSEPSAASIPLSTASCRIRSLRVAPSARRRANSSLRSTLRTASSPPRLSAATRKTRMAAAHSTRSAGFTWPRSTSRRGWTTETSRLSASQVSALVSSSRRSSSAFASAGVAPGRRRPTKSRVPYPASAIASGLIAASVTHASAPAGRAKSPGMTPTMV